MAPNLCLGTVQFGLPYGITNQTGQVTQDEVKRIIELCERYQIRSFDTAQAYGDAEKILGDNLLLDVPYQITSKLSSLTDPKTWENSFQLTLQRLQVDSLNTFLLHSPSKFPSELVLELFSWLDTLRTRGYVQRIGVSIYSASDLVSLDQIQVVQLPLSLYDQRLLHDGTIDTLSRAHISICARSIFLQGLILKQSEHWPNFSPWNL